MTGTNDFDLRFNFLGEDSGVKNTMKCSFMFIWKTKVFPPYNILARKLASSGTLGIKDLSGC